MKTVNEFGTVNEVLEKYPEIDYAIIWRHNEATHFSEFVAAWNYDEATGTWGQGHYFCDLLSTTDYIEEKLAKYWENKEAE